MNHQLSNLLTVECTRCTKCIKVNKGRSTPYGSQSLSQADCTTMPRKPHHPLRPLKRKKLPATRNLRLPGEGTTVHNGTATRDGDEAPTAQIDPCLDILQIAQINRSMNTANTWRAQSGVS